MKPTVQDQWFSPGDKVMRVARAIQDLGLPANSDVVNPLTDFGRVLCVDDCWHDGHVPHVSFVGVDGCFWPQCFRRVEEIRLCMNAVKKADEPVEV